MEIAPDLRVKPFLSHLSGLGTIASARMRSNGISPHLPLCCICENMLSAASVALLEVDCCLALQQQLRGYWKQEDGFHQDCKINPIEMKLLSLHAGGFGGPSSWIH